MQCKNVDEDRIKYTLRNRTKLLEYIRHQRDLLYGEIVERDSSLEAISLKSRVKGANDVGNIQCGNGRTEILLRILEDEQKMIREESLVLQEKLGQLINQEEEINRIWICYKELPLKQFQIIEHLYVKNEKFYYVEQSLEMDHRKFCTLRKNAISFIKILFYSNYTNREIVQKQYQGKIKAFLDKKISKPKEINGQLSLFRQEKKND